MSISPLHGGLVFNDAPAKPQTVSTKQEETKSGSPLDLNTRDINEFFNPRVSDLTLDERVKLCLSVGEEVIQESELSELLAKK